MEKYKDVFSNHDVCRSFYYRSNVTDYVQETDNSKAIMILVEVNIISSMNIEKKN